MAGPIFGWVKVWLLAQFWLDHILAGPIMLDRYYGWAILAGLMAGLSIGPAKNLARPIFFKFCLGYSFL
jgi:hypothetical protein